MERVLSDKEAEFIIKKYYNKTKYHKTGKGDIIFTEFQLCRKMLNSIPKNYLDKDKNILVISNLEFVYILMLILGHEYMKNVWFFSFTEEEGEIASAMGVCPKHIKHIVYNRINLDSIMKFDIVIENCPYNGQTTAGKGGGSGKAIWQKFVLYAIESLKDSGYFICIHPDDWRRHYENPELTKHKESKEKRMVFKHLTDGGLKELHMMEETAFNGIGVSVDWYCYQKGRKEISRIFFPDGSDCDTNLLELKEPLTRMNVHSLEYSIMSKTLGLPDYENGIIINRMQDRRGLLFYEKDGEKFVKGFSMLKDPKGKYKQAYGARWTKGEWMYSEFPHIDQFENKVIFCRIGEQRAKFVDDNIGVAAENHYWKIKEKIYGDSIAALINSSLVKFLRPLLFQGNSSREIIPDWFWKRLNIEGIKGLTTDGEFYEHFKLTEEEIKLIKQ